MNTQSDTIEQTQTQELEVINPKEFGLDEKQGSDIQSAFMPKIVEREALKTLYEQLITRELNAELSAEAGTLRKKLVKVRTGISEIHKTQKAFFLAGGRFADSIKNKETLPIEQMEEKLFEIEKWAEIQEEKRVEALKAERLETLKQFEVDGTMMALGHMTDDIWTNYLSGVKLNYEAKKQAEAKAEADRIELERLQAEEQEKQRLENIRLKQEAEEKERELIEVKLKAQREKDRLELNAQLEKNAADAEAKKLKEQAEAKLKAERDKSDKLAAELKAKADAEAKIEADRIKAEKLAKAAPDKIKLEAVAKSIDVIINLSKNNFASAEAKKIHSDSLALLKKV